MLITLVRGRAAGRGVLATIALAAVGALAACGSFGGPAGAAPTVAPASSSAAAIQQVVTQATALGRSLYVSPTGKDSAAGTRTKPLKTIQAALDKATPGTVIHLAAGSYPKGGTTVHNGTATAPITIEGPAAGVDPRTGTVATATVYGTGHVIAVKNSYYVLDGFTINGQAKLTTAVPESRWPGQSLAAAQKFKSSESRLVVNSRPIYIDGGAGHPVDATKIFRMTVEGSGGECVRVRDNAVSTAIVESVIRWCGMYPQPGTGAFLYHNGEGVYVGTSPKSTDLVNHSNDQTRDTVLAGDVITTFGSECLDVKENAYGNVLESSVCADNLEPLSYEGSNVELRGYDNEVLDNRITNSAGYGVKIASDTPAEDRGHNVVEKNTFGGQTGSVLDDKSNAPAGPMCGNGSGLRTPSSWAAAC